MSESKLDAKSTRQMMAQNRLDYSLPPPVSLVASGTVFKKNNADQQTYTSSSGTELIVTLQSSTDFVYGPDCYLRFDVKADGLVTTAANDVALGFLNSPATALFSDFLLEDKSGEEVERILELNKYVRNALPWKYPDDYRKTVQMAGQSPYRAVQSSITGQDIIDASVIDTTAVGTGSYLRVCIPLWYFSGLFKEETFIPPQLISGMKFRLTLAKATQALSIIASATGAVPAGFADGSLSYTISDPVIVLSSYSLAPTIQRNVLEMMSRPQGVPYVYESVYNQKGTPGTLLDHVLQVNKAVARASKLYSVSQNIIADSSQIDNLGSMQLSEYQYQTRVGDWYAPQQILQLGKTDTSAGVRRNCAELYANNLQCTRGLRGAYHPPSVSEQEFASLYGPTGEAETTVNGGFACIIQDLNQSPHIGQSGIAINNSRTAEVRLRYNSQATGSKSISAWLQYVKIASVYPMRTVIKS